MLPRAHKGRRTTRRSHPQETRMPERGPQYNHIGSNYDEYSQTATLRRTEMYTVLRMTGPLRGKRVLDMACGLGFSRGS